MSCPELLELSSLVKEKDFAVKRIGLFESKEHRKNVWGEIRALENQQTLSLNTQDKTVDVVTKHLKERVELVNEVIAEQWHAIGVPEPAVVEEVEVVETKDEGESESAAADAGKETSPPPLESHDGADSLSDMFPKSDK